MLFELNQLNLHQAGHLTMIIKDQYNQIQVNFPKVVYMFFPDDAHIIINWLSQT